MSSDQLTRRLFLQSSAGTAFVRAGIAGLVTIAESACTARDEAAAFTTLSPADAREFEAIASRILPTTDTPGAREAGVIWFMDKTFGTFGAEYLSNAREGLAEFQSPVGGAFPGAQKFSDLDEADQDRHLQTQEDSEFFGLMHFMTVLGFFGMSKYGGNRDDAGWKLLGLDGHHQGWQPPFGYYDAEYVSANRSQGDNHGE
ncbi:MAG: gluconate 2-dehydrogenase subunit 3 family protein [Gammaproteobacteria bacterium]|nr:gluconate 2-dehydrogenase subunit 3 family protein [Gammaproteobacteria bacterium]MDH4314035.1 gluconate 2-dehydrogenase subunit 3 family protein [Gammaproteobacteria bacterium]MDH5213525.1 gluconate 2-dehydrogenase subunit 3 family protein [Gammaproteobacteria bacterium]MDH5501409.1 gluconate 2-dehydrogenase subunit 3 family protein [Gammaproteobacteria bacterium]